MKDMKIESWRGVQGGGRSASPRKALEVLKLVVVWCLAGDDVEMSSEGHENRKLEGGAGGRAQRIPHKALEVLKLVVVWCLAGDDIEMSSEGHENRKLEGGARC